MKAWLKKLARPPLRFCVVTASAPVPALGVRLTTAEPARVLPHWSMALMVTLKSWPMIADGGL